jgi:hypothetical protein
LGAAGIASAQTPYGMAISLEQAKKVMVGAEAEAKKNSWPVAIVIVDSGSNIVMMQKLDNTQHGSVDIARGKAATAVNLRRPTKALEDAIAAGGNNLRLLAVNGVYPLERTSADSGRPQKLRARGCASQGARQDCGGGLDRHGRARTTGVSGRGRAARSSRPKAFRTLSIRECRRCHCCLAHDSCLPCSRSGLRF